MPAAVLFHPPEAGHDLTHVGGGPELERLRRHVPDQILGKHLGKASHIEDVFLRIQGHELPAQGRKRVDDPGRRSPHAGVEGGEQTGRAAADDGYVPQFLLGHWFSRVGALGYWPLTTRDS